MEGKKALEERQKVDRMMAEEKSKRHIFNTALEEANRLMGPREAPFAPPSGGFYNAWYIIYEIMEKTSVNSIIEMATSNSGRYWDAGSKKRAFNGRVAEALQLDLEMDPAPSPPPPKTTATTTSEQREKRAKEKEEALKKARAIRERTEKLMKEQEEMKRKKPKKRSVKDTLEFMKKAREAGTTWTKVEKFIVAKHDKKKEDDDEEEMEVDLAPTSVSPLPGPSAVFEDDSLPPQPPQPQVPTPNPPVATPRVKTKYVDPYEDLIHWKD